MVIWGVVIKAYSIMTFATIADEVWNIKNPRPYPAKSYHCLQWEEKDFYTFKVNDEWILRKYRKTDSKTKRLIRTKYWEKRNG